MEHRGFRVVLDLGYGTVGRLLEVLGSSSAEGLHAVVVTHQHADHMVDLHGLFRARWMGGGRGEAAVVPLFAPQGVVDVLLAMDEDVAEPFPKVFAHRPLPGGPFEVGPFRLRSWGLPHFVPNAGVRLESDDLTVAYTGDTAPVPELVELARDADLFIAEASGQGDDQPDRLYLTARDSGEVAAAANAKRLLLMHLWPGMDREATRRAAQEVYDGEVVLADEGLAVELP